MADTQPVDQLPGLTQTLIALMPDIHILISDGHYSAAGAQLSAALQAQILDQTTVDRAIKAAENARCPHHQGPFGGFDYGHGREEPVEGGRHVIRDFRDPFGPDWGKWVHQTDDPQEHERTYQHMTDDHIVRSTIKSIFEKPRQSS